MLGGVGVVLTVTTVVLVWWGAFALASRSQQVTTRADQGLVQVEEGLARMQKELESNSQAVEAVRASALGARGRPNNAATEVELARLRNTLLPLLERADALRGVLPTVAKAIDSTADVVEQGGRDKSRSDRLRSVADNVRDATATLESVRKQSAALRRGESAPTAQELADLAEQAQVPMDLLAKGLSDARQQSDSIRGELPGVRQFLDDWKVKGPAILTGVLLWLGLGQLAIVAWGRRRLAARTPPEPRRPGSP